MVDQITEYFQTQRQGQIYRAVMDYTERILIEKALEQTCGNQISASRILGLNRNTLRRKIRRLNINMGRFKP